MHKHRKLQIWAQRWPESLLLILVADARRRAACSTCSQGAHFDWHLLISSHTDTWSCLRGNVSYCLSLACQSASTRLNGLTKVQYVLFFFFFSANPRDYDVISAPLLCLICYQHVKFCVIDCSPWAFGSHSPTWRIPPLNRVIYLLHIFLIFVRGNGHDLISEPISQFAW